MADHRKHHAHTDEEGDPHSRHVGHGDGLKGALHGLWSAHMGWLFDTQGRASARGDPPATSWRTPGCAGSTATSSGSSCFGLAIPFGLGYAIDGTLTGALTAMLWGGLVRVFMLHHVTWSINSVCHFFGRRRFDIEDQSTNVLWLALPSMGESWHHNHHAFPRAAVHGLRWWEVDITGSIIRTMRRLKLAWNVVEITQRHQAQKEPQVRRARGGLTASAPTVEGVAAAAPLDRAARRFTVSIIFALNGLVFGSWASRIPAIKERCDRRRGPRCRARS